MKIQAIFTETRLGVTKSEEVTIVQITRGAGEGSDVVFHVTKAGEIKRGFVQQYKVLSVE